MKNLIRLNSGAIMPLSDENGNGFYNTLATEIFKRLDIKLYYISHPSTLALIHAKHGVDERNTARIKGMEKEWPNLVIVPDPIMTWEFTAYANQDFDLTVDG